ncbi:MAG: phospho-N-acetylmuramoyl-pentapeptide-transferase [Faecalibacterium sp.]|jgi:phospho-N-acetylmuramoyl-pentapeptide-transferase|nr:phospho-N-acetylmuramoyl-pentapeptide-transferase [Faecalibacterium sp.]
MVNALISAFGQEKVNGMAALVSFALTALMLGTFRGRLPQDHGRQFAVNGALSRGKARGAGLIFTLCIVLVTLAFVPFSGEILLYMVLLAAAMLSGYLDDASDKPWNEYKKGLIDLLIALAAALTFLNFDSPEIWVCGVSVQIPAALYLLLAVVLIWGSINVTNCSDGVDGLCGTLCLVTMGTFLLAFSSDLGGFSTAVLVVMASVAAYLWNNVSPSNLLMGDAGSRALGFFVAVLAMKSHHPLAWLLAAAVMILDGGLGILKISLKRFLHIWILKNTRTPLHDEARKNHGWSDPQVVLRFAVLQGLASLVLFLVK